MSGRVENEVKIKTVQAKRTKKQAIIADMFW
jgi:hypothetical protein